MDPIMDLIVNGQAFGNVAQQMLADGMSINSRRKWIESDGRCYMTVNGQPRLVANATLRKDEWKHYDTAVIRVAQDRLVGVAGCMRRGLVYRLGNGMGKMVLEYEDMGDLNDAEMNMDGVSRSANDKLEYSLKYLPLPIIHKDFQLNIRMLNASRTTGAPMDTSMSQGSARKVSEKVEDIFYNGASAYNYGGGTIRGLLDHPDRNTVTLSTDWADSAATGESILDDVRAMKQELLDAGFYGPYILDVPSNWDTVLDDDFKANSDRTIRERIMAIDGITEVKVADKLTASHAVMYQATDDVVRIVEGLPITTVEWEVEGGMVVKMKVMTIMVPQIRSDQDGNSGVCELAA